MYEFTDKKGSLTFKVYSEKNHIEGEIKKKGMKGETRFGECTKNVNGWVFYTDDNGQITKVRWFTVKARRYIGKQDFGQKYQEENAKKIKTEMERILTANPNNPAKAEAEIQKFLDNSDWVEKYDKGPNFGKSEYQLWKYPEGPLAPKN